MHIDSTAAHTALTPLAESLGMSLEAFADSAIRVADANIEPKVAAPPELPELLLPLPPDAEIFVLPPPVPPSLLETC